MGKCVYVCVCVYVCMYVYTCVYLCVYVIVYVCVCVYVHAKPLQMCPALCNPMDYSPQGSSVHGIF